MDPKDEIKSYVKSYLDALSTLEITNMVSHFSPDITTFFIGTAKNEIFKSIQDIEKSLMWQISQEVEYEVLYPEFINLELKETIAWCAYYLHIQIRVGEHLFSFRYRVTLVLEKIDRRWYIRQSHGSASQAGVEEGNPFPSIRGIQEQITYWIEHFNVNPDLTIVEKKKREELKSYLLKARDLAHSIEST